MTDPTVSAELLEARAVRLDLAKALSAPPVGDELLLLLARAGRSLSKLDNALSLPTHPPSPERDIVYAVWVDEIEGLVGIFTTKERADAAAARVRPHRTVVQPLRVDPVMPSADTSVTP
jgi:hypothetical protein